MTAAVLAAGASSRFGAHKPLVPLGGAPVGAPERAGPLDSPLTDGFGRRIEYLRISVK